MTRKLFNGDFDWEDIVNKSILELRSVGETDVTPTNFIENIRELNIKINEFKTEYQPEIDELEDSVEDLERENSSLEDEVDELNETLSYVKSENVVLEQFFFKYILNSMNEINHCYAKNKQYFFKEVVLNKTTYKLIIRYDNNKFNYNIIGFGEDNERSYYGHNNFKDIFPSELHIIGDMDKCFLNGVPDIADKLTEIEFYIKNNMDKDKCEFIKEMLKLDKFENNNVKSVYDVFDEIIKNKLYLKWVSNSEKLIKILNDDDIKITKQ